MKLVAVTAIAALGGSVVGGAVAASVSSLNRDSFADYFGDLVVAGEFSNLDPQDTVAQVIASGDIDGDSLPDLVISGVGWSFGQGIAFFKNDGFGSYVLEARIDGLGRNFTITDVNGDGINEVVGVQFDGGGIGRIVILPNLLAPWQPSPARAADLNGDQMVDGADLGLMLGLWGPVGPQ
jgi:hypothetical protein